jgi:NAD(P)H dehydrogenase (quinone)
MYVVTGITGRVGGITGGTLLDAGLPVRAVVRDATKEIAWKERGCQVALADMNDAPALAAALTRVNGVFVLIPPIFDPTPGFPEVRAIIAAVTTAIETAKPPKVVVRVSHPLRPCDRVRSCGDLPGFRRLVLSQ